jgi:hypothetical protein
MAKNTSILLGDYFDNFINQQIQTGCYSSVSEVVRTWSLEQAGRYINLILMKQNIYPEIPGGEEIPAISGKTTTALKSKISYNLL